MPDPHPGIKFHSNNSWLRSRRNTISAGQIMSLRILKTFRGFQWRPHAANQMQVQNVFLSLIYTLILWQSIIRFNLPDMETSLRITGSNHYSTLKFILDNHLKKKKLQVLEFKFLRLWDFIFSTTNRKRVQDNKTKDKSSVNFFYWLAKIFCNSKSEYYIR